MQVETHQRGQSSGENGDGASSSCSAAEACPCALQSQGCWWQPVVPQPRCRSLRTCGRCHQPTWPSSAESCLRDPVSDDGAVLQALAHWPTMFQGGMGYKYPGVL